MHAMLTEEDLSLRHLPEVSDYSFSFQIPTSSLPKDDDLMAEDSTFFGGANINSTLATPAPPPKATAHLHPRAVQLTPRPIVLESSPTHRRLQTLVPSGSPSVSYGYAELQQSPITEAPISSKGPEAPEAEDPHKEERNREHQDQEELQEPQQCLSPSTTSSTTLDNILSTQPTFPGRSPLGSCPEVGHSELDLLQIESRSHIDSVARDRTKQEQRRSSRLAGALRSSVGDKPGRPPLMGKVRSMKPPKKPTVAAGIVKSRSKKKAATTSLCAPNITSSAIHKRPTQPEQSLGLSAADKLLGSDLSLSSFASAEGAAGRLVMYGQQFMNERDDIAGLNTRGTEPNCLPGTITMQLGTNECQDVDMSPGDRQVDQRAGHITHTNDFGDQDDDRDKPLTISQLSPRKRSKERWDNRVSSFPPTLPVPEPTSRSGTLSKERLAAAALVSCHDQQVPKKGRDNGMAVGAKARSDQTAIPVHTVRLTMAGPSSTVVSAASPVVPKVEPYRSGTAANGSDVFEEKEGVREEAMNENVGGAGHANTELLSSEIISTSRCGNFAGNKRPGQAISAKELVKRPVDIGARTRLRKSSRLSSSVNGGRSLRTRSTSKSASVAEEVLRASERERRFALVRARKEAKGKDRLARLAEQQDGSEGSSSVNRFKRSAITHSTGRTRPVDFKFATHLRMQTRQVDGQSMSRSASSWSSSSGGAGVSGTSKRAHPIPDFKAIHTQHGAALAHLKENLHPILPQPFQWATEQRLRERKEFDDMVREKEREREELEDQKRREREEEEEREIRVLRKRAVPKANTVPEWYKDAPRRRRMEKR